MVNNENKKPVPERQPENEPAETNTSGQTGSASTPILPQTDTKYNGFVSSMLPRGKENPIPGRVLVNMLKLKNLRDLTQIIEHERKAGAPICASTDSHNPGYYIADSADELEAYINSLDRRIKNVRLTRLYCMRTLREMGR